MKTTFFSFTIFYNIYFWNFYEVDATPTENPTFLPSVNPTFLPSVNPTFLPTVNPTFLPTVNPTFLPTVNPSLQPTFSPSTLPSHSPTHSPSIQPSSTPSLIPSVIPSVDPTFSPSTVPTLFPTLMPSCTPTTAPTFSPSSFPTFSPTVSPTSLPSGQPTSLPSSTPSSCPSSTPTNPTSLPSGEPSSMPSSEPTSVPSSLPTSVPSSLPTSVPSSIPTGTPSSIPSSAPTSPTSLPTGIPTAQPSSQPSSIPSSEPSSVPSDMPSSQPTTEPSSLPTGIPTSFPSGFPTNQPSSQPTTPTSIPSGEPSALPTGQPTSYPTTLPSGAPSSCPTGQPTSTPSSNPTGLPTSIPSGIPTCFPSSLPTTPTSIPTSIPTSQPSGEPSSLPTAIPSSIPTSNPSGIPSAEPTSTPTNPTSIPSGIPTSLPSGEPSSSPTSVPTLASDPRILPCGQCQSTENQQCIFFTFAVVLECSNGNICVYDVRTFVVERETNIFVTNNCTLKVVTRDMITHPLSSIKASALNIYATHNVTIQGELVTSGEGPINGPGSGLGTGKGGSYGGSGGNLVCTDQYFSNYPSQIGSVNVSTDIFDVNTNRASDIAVFNSTSGSGGGMLGSKMGGKGGGSILIRSRTLNITGAQLRADGGHSSVSNLGSGSGGSITILVSIYRGRNSLFSAKGGNGVLSRNISAGSGGRIYIQYISGSPKSITYIVQGGEVDMINPCLAGASGSLLIYPFPTTTYTTAVLTFGNGNQKSRAVSIYTEKSISAKLLTLEITQYAAVASDHISLPMQCTTTLTCKSRVIVSKSSILTSLISLNGILSPADRIIISADTIDVSSSSSLVNAYYIAIDSKSFTVDASSTANFGCNITIRNTLQTLLLGQVNQLYSPTFCTETANPLNRIGVTIQGYNVTLHTASTQYLFVTANMVALNSGGYIGIPFAYNNLSTCWSEVNASEFSCSNSAKPADITSAHYLSNSVTIIGLSSIKVNSGAIIRSSLVTLCAPLINSVSTSLVITDGLGCPHDAGVGAGSSPLESSDSGGGGAGYGGAGGYGDSNSAGGIVYGEGYNIFSVGSGGGTLYSNVATLSSNSSAGGGIIIFNATKSITINGLVSSGGSNGILNYGGGSGGLVALYAPNIKGYGCVQVLGGIGGPLGGGGGGGGRIVVQSPGKYDDSFHFPGYMNLTGGNTIVPTMSAPGYPGQLALPICGPGYGNDYDTLTTCVKCPVGTYHDTYDGEECSKCKNKPVNSEYTTSGMTNKNCDYQCFSGYVNDNCITPFERFLASMGGITSFVSVVVGMTCLIFPPLYILRLRRKAELLKKQSAIQSNSASTLVPEIGSSNWFNPVLDQQLLDIDEKDKHSSPDRESIGNLEVGLDQRPNLVGEKKKNGTESFQDLRIAYRMADKDLPHHAARVYLWGSNSPFSREGGNWQLALEPPPTLKNSILRPEYQAFARTLNDRLRWNAFGYEAMVYTLISILFPPYAEYWMIRCRLSRAKALIYLITRSEPPFFKYKLRGDPISHLKVGISPDLTVAYLDFVFDDGSRSVHRPLNKIGQPRFPLALRICGLGTYFSPWYIDTNDILMQAISQSSEFAVFIDKSWINFIIELNNILKTMRKHRLRSDLMKLLKFLIDESKVGSLGGLIIQFCTFISELQANTSSISSPVSTGESKLQTPTLQKSRSTTQRTNTSSVETLATANDPLTEFGRLKSSDKGKKTGDHTLVSFIFGRENEDELSLAESTWTDDKTPTKSDHESSPPPRTRYPSAEPSPENEFSLTYEETCRLLESGLRLPGLVIFHESTPLFEVVHSPGQPLTIESQQQQTPRRYSNAALPIPEVRESLLDNERDSMIDIKKNAREVYGDRADELAKFYRIVREADKSTGLSPEQTNPIPQINTPEAEEKENVPRTSDERDSSSSPSQSNIEAIQIDELSDYRGSTSRRSTDEADRRVTPKSQRWDHIHDNAMYIRSSGHLSHVNIWYWNASTNVPTQLKLLDDRSTPSTPAISPENHQLPTSFILSREEFHRYLYFTPFFRQYEEEEAYGIYIFEYLEMIIITAIRYLSHSRNRAPYSNPIYRKIASICLFLLMVVDIAFSCVISINFWCIWDDYTLCEDHTGFILGVVMWPGALVLTPIAGLLTVAVNPTGIFARHFVSWSRLAAASLITLFTIYFYWYENSPYSTLYYLLGMAASRILQLLISDPFIASHESVRTSRGWGGLFTNILNDEYAFR